jgi:hypothetical protein
MWRRSPRNGVARQARDLTDECEALLRGGLVEYLQAEGRWTPPWAWVNALAHGSVDDLVRWAEGGVDHADDPSLSDAAGWRAVLSFLAGDILSRVGAGGTTLEELQRSALIPLELDLMRGVERPTPDQGRLAGMVMAAVRRPQR